MKKLITIVLLSITLIFCLSFGVLANAANSNLNGSQPITASKHVTQSSQVANQPQTLVKPDGQKTDTPSKTVNGFHPSKLAKLKNFFHNKIVRPFQLGWQHVKGLIQKHHTKSNPVTN